MIASSRFYQNLSEIGGDLSAIKSVEATTFV